EDVVALAAGDVLDAGRRGQGELEVAVDGLLGRAAQVQSDARVGAGEGDGALAGAVLDGVAAQGRVSHEGVGRAAGGDGEGVVECVAGEDVVAIAADDVLDAGGRGQRELKVSVDRLLRRAAQVEGTAGRGAGEGDGSLAGGVLDGVRAQGRVGHE